MIASDITKNSMIEKYNSQRYVTDAPHVVVGDDILRRNPKITTKKHEFAFWEDDGEKRIGQHDKRGR